MKNIFVVQTDERGKLPILNGSKVSDADGREYTYISSNQKEGTVTVKDSLGHFRTDSAPTFFLSFEEEEQD